VAVRLLNSLFPSNRRLTAGLVALAAATLVAYLLSDPLSLRLAANSLFFGLMTAAWVLPLSVFAALAVTKTCLFARGGAFIVLILWLFTPDYVHIAGWRDLFGPQGWFPLSLAGPGTNLIDGATGVVWLNGITLFPWTTLLLAYGYRNVDASLEEEALADASPLRVLQRVTLWQNRDGLIVALLWVMICVFGNMSIASVCNVRTYAEVVFTGIPLGYSISQSSLTILPGILFAACLTILAVYIIYQLAPTQAKVSANHKRMHLRSWQAWFSVATWSLLVLGLLPSAVGLIHKVGLEVTHVDGNFIRGWSAEKSLRLTLGSLTAYQTELTWSFLLATTVAVVTTVVAFLLADRVARSSRWQVFVVLLIAGLFALPKPIVGIVLSWSFSRPIFAWAAALVDRTIFVPSLAILTVTLPIAIVYLWHQTSRQHHLIEMSQVDGTTWSQRLVWVSLPNQWPGLLTTFLISFVLAANDISASILVLPPGIDTLSRRIFGLLHFGGEDNVAGILLMNWLAVAVIATIAHQLARRPTQSR